MVPEGAKHMHTTRELEEELRKRLRVESVIWAIATGVIALTATLVQRDQLRINASTFWTAPPLPGVLFVICVVTIGAVWLLSPRRHLGIARLRAIEWLGVAATASFLIVDEAVDLRGMLSALAIKPMDLGLGLGAPWGALIVAYGVLIPSNLRHSFLRTAALAACAFLPEILVLPRVGVLGPGVMTYLTLKLIAITVLSALALYGSYRIDELSEDARSARQLGQYTLRRALGEGGMGSVYLADHQFLRRPCAIKLIRPELASDDAARARFEREVQSAATLTHPNTVQIYDYGQSEDGAFYYAMEYLPGVSLQELVEQQGPLPPARAVRILTQLCGALGEAHARGLVHRDLKPGNVMLCERGGVEDVVKLLDFGLVAGLREGASDPKITQAGLIIGTPAFMSPEQCAGEANVTSLSDIYSLGALGYFLVIGHAPFVGRSELRVLAAHLYESPPSISELRPDVPPELVSVLERCLAKDPILRFSDAASVEHALVHSIATSS
jgi:serine/threonine-protein kinase